MPTATDYTLTVIAPDYPADGGPVCGCGAGTHPTKLNRCVRGHVGKGNSEAKTHGLRAATVSDAVRLEREAFAAASIADDGATDVPTRRAALHTYRARLHVAIEMLGDAIERHGLIDRRGRLRGSWLQRFDSLCTTATRLDLALGLERRPAPIRSASDLVREGR